MNSKCKIDQCGVFCPFSNLFKIFWLCWVFFVEGGLSLVVSWGATALWVWCMDFLLPWHLKLWNTGPRVQPLSVSSHPKYRQHHTHPLYDITLAICVASFALYKTSHTHFMTSNHRVYVITHTIFDMVSTVCGCAITSTVLMISHQLYFWDHIR